MPRAKRRSFVTGAAAALAGAGCRVARGRAPVGPVAATTDMPRFRTDAPALQRAWDAAVTGLRGNLKVVFRFDRLVLIEGGGYPGIWLECGPHESLAFAPFAPDAAVASHEVFFALQREDGYLPCWVWRDRSGTSQIQMVVPIAATALELFQRTQDERFLLRAYDACARWDAWLRRYRDTRGTGLCEAFCGFDTGHDNSPRFRGLPWRCPDQDARVCPKVGALPYLAPDLSATVFGGRRALAAMARHLGRGADEARWLEDAEHVRAALFRHCFDEEDLCFFDRDAAGAFVRMRGDAMLRVLGEHVVDQPLFDRIFARHVHDPARFWTPYPLPSIAVDDPAFDRAMPLNSWGGPSQALTALRAPRWLEHYRRPAALAHVLRRWTDALVRAGEFRQQIDPWTGAASTSSRYSPAMLVLLDSVARLHGVREDGDDVVWGCGLPDGARSARFELPARAGVATLDQDASGATLRLAGRTLAHVTGTAALRTDRDGAPRALVGIAAATADVVVATPDERARRVSLAPDATVAL